MTHPLTPREKVADRGPAGAVMDALWPILGGDQMDAETWTEISVAVGTALASGSGDHAELARLADDLRGPWLSRIKQNKAADALESLLAENAALRGDVDRMAEVSEQCSRWIAAHDEQSDRATEAERKLAEAVAVIRDVDRAARQAASMNDAGYTVTVERTATHIYGITDAFLFSREAERG